MQRGAVGLRGFYLDLEPHQLPDATTFVTLLFINESTCLQQKDTSAEHSTDPILVSSGVCVWALCFVPSSFLLLVGEKTQHDVTPFSRSHLFREKGLCT